MRQHVITTGIVLSRTDFQEADRIVTILTPDRGKVRVIAKGVRRPNSKLAGGIELFSVSNITVLPGRGDISTLLSSRLITHYDHIVKDIQRTMLGYDLLKRTNRVTEDGAGQEFFELLQATLAGLDDLELSAELVELWFSMQMLYITGHMLNLKNDVNGKRLELEQQYVFDFEIMAFSPQKGGPFTANHIKLLRLSYGTDNPSILKQVKGAAESAPDALNLAKNTLGRFVRV